METSRFPINYKVVANGHRHSPTARPMIWDTVDRRVERPPRNGVVECAFCPEHINSGSGWVSRGASGAYQLRVGKLTGSTEPLVVFTLPSLQGKVINVDYVVNLHEARQGDPNAKGPKAFLKLGRIDLGHLELAGPEVPDRGTFLMNAQSLESLSFRVDVTDLRTGELLARGFCAHESLADLEGRVNVTLLTRDMECAGTFAASFLVVTEFAHRNNNLAQLLRAPWVAGGQSLNIGHRGAGESQTASAKLVRENTLLSFMTAATSKAMEYVEFDVHLTKDGECVIYHDFDVKLFVGDQVVKVGVPTLTLEQIQSEDFQQRMASHLEMHDQGHQSNLRKHRQRFETERTKRKTTLKRSASGDETFFRDKGLDDMIDEIQEERMRSSRSPGPNGTRAGTSSRLAMASHAESSVRSSIQDSDNFEDAAYSRKDDEALGPGGVPLGSVKKEDSRWTIQDRVTTLREMFRRLPRWLGFNVEVKYPTEELRKTMPFHMYKRNAFVDAILKVVFQEARGRKVIFSTFDPDCATLLSLKQPRFPVFFLTCSGTEQYLDPRMNSLEAAIAFSRASQLQGIVADSLPLLEGGNCAKVVDECHKHGLYLFTWGPKNNDLEFVNEQRRAGVDAVISDDLFRFHRETEAARSSRGNSPPLSKENSSVLPAEPPPAHPPAPAANPPVPVKAGSLKAPLSAAGSVVPLAPFSPANIVRPTSVVDLVATSAAAEGAAGAKGPSVEGASVPSTPSRAASPVPIPSSPIPIEAVAALKVGDPAAIPAAAPGLVGDPGLEALADFANAKNEDGLEWTQLTRPLPDTPDDPPAHLSQAAH